MDPTSKIWVHIAPELTGEQKACLKVRAFKTEDELLQSNEFLKGQNDLVLLVCPNDVLDCDRTSAPEPSSGDLSWNLQLAAALSSPRRRRDRYRF